MTASATHGAIDTDAPFFQRIKREWVIVAAEAGNERVDAYCTALIEISKPYLSDEQMRTLLEVIEADHRNSNQKYVSASSTYAHDCGVPQEKIISLLTLTFERVGA